MSQQDILNIVSVVVGWISMGMVCAYAIPQFVKTWKTKNTSSMALISYLMFAICSSLMLAWNIGQSFKLQEDTKWSIARSVLTLLPTIVLNSLNVTLNIWQLILKIRHLKLAKKWKVSELEVSDILLAKKIKKGGR